MYAFCMLLQIYCMCLAILRMKLLILALELAIALELNKGKELAKSEQNSEQHPKLNINV